MTTGLSPRLDAIAKLVLPGMVVADIGTDHGLLPLSLLRANRATRVIATDVAAAPLQRAASKANLVSGLELRRGDGLHPLIPGEVQVVVIAGMGGYRVRRILEAAPAVTQELTQLILQPNGDWSLVRAMIAAKRWRLCSELLVEDAGRFYLTLDVRCAERDDAIVWTPLDLVFGPLLRRERGPTFMRFLEHRKVTLQRALRKLKTRAPEQAPGIAVLERELAALAEVSDAG